MVNRITLDELANNLLEIVERVYTEHEEYVVEREGVPLITVGSASQGKAESLTELFEALNRLGPMDDDWADDLEAVHREMNRPIGLPR